MKNLILTSTIILGFSFASCKKDYTCDCTIVVHSDNGAGATTNSTTQVPYALTKAKKSEAETWCNNLDDSDESTSMGGTVTTVDYTCVLK